MPRIRVIIDVYGNVERRAQRGRDIDAVPSGQNAGNRYGVVAGGHRCGHGHADADQLAGFGVDAAQGLIDEQHGAFQRCVRLVAQRQGERVLSDD